MSDHFNGKDYGDYFESLERRLNKAEKPEEPPKTSVKPTQKSRVKKKHGIYKVIKIRKAVLALNLAAAVISVAVFALSHNGKGEAVPQAATESKTDEPVKTDNTVEKIVYNIPEDAKEIPADNDCEGAIIVNTATHTAVAARNPKKRLYPASTTKLMTLLVACDNIESYDDTFTMTLDITDPLYVAEASVAGFLNGEVISMTDLLYGLILPSGADAAVALTQKISGGETEFVKLMNAKAKELGLKDTRFANATGLFDKEQYTTAYDMAIILETALKNPICKKVISTYQYTTSKTEQHPEGIPLSATLFEYMYGTEPETATILGGKTGFVNESGYCIASYGTNNTTGNEYIVVTLKNSSRWPAFHGQIDLYKQFAD